MTKVSATPDKDDVEQRLPLLVDGEMLTVVDVALKEKKTRAPKPYTEGDLIEDMKNAGKYVEDSELSKVLKATSGLGTSATRDSVIEALKHHKYLVVAGKTIVPTEKGTKFILWLEKVCPELVDIALTARWEARLDIVASHGGGVKFETDVAARIRELVTIFKSCPTLDHHPKEKSNMSDQASGSGRSGKPTDKMLEFAKRIADKLKIDLGEHPLVLTEYDACSAFIETNKALANRPTDKQTSFATRIATEKGLTIPPEAAADGRELSKWIDANK